MRYPCLILDHDDTVVNSTATIHFAAFNAFMATARPHINITLEEYFYYNFEPGVLPFFRDICGLNDSELVEEEAFWKNYVRTRIPEAYPGLKEILRTHKENGGAICVSSHSFSHYIRRDYEANGLPEPDLVYGWDLDPDKRKPSPFAVFDIEEKLGYKPSEILIVDDLKPGHDMARAAGVTFAASGWAADVPEIETFMRANCDYYCKTVEDLGRLLEA